jgi:hypothetical protein
MVGPAVDHQVTYLLVASVGQGIADWVGSQVDRAQGGQREPVLHEVVLAAVHHGGVERRQHVVLEGVDSLAGMYEEVLDDEQVAPRGEAGGGLLFQFPP